MDNENNDFVVFQGIEPKPPASPNLAHFFKCSADYGGWWDSCEPKRKQRYKKKVGRQKRGKVRLSPDE